MKNNFARFALSVSKINKNHIQIAFSIIALVMLVVGAGAPDDMGGAGG